MKKTILMAGLAIILASCSSTKLKNEKQIQNYKYMSADQIKTRVSEIVDSHDEFTAEQKVEIKQIIQDGVETNSDLRVKQSKLAQLMLDTLLSKENPKPGEINRIKSDMKKVYKMKEKNLISTAKELKKIIGVSEEHQRFAHEIFPYLNR